MAMDLLQPYIGITLKLITGMIGILASLRITGKAQMGQISPLDTVSASLMREMSSEVQKRLPQMT